MDVFKSPTLGLLHDHPDGLLIAFKIPLHGPEHPKLGGHALQGGSQLPQPFRGGIPVLLPVLLPQGKAGNHIVGGHHLVLCLFQGLAAGIQVGFRFFQSGFSGGNIRFQLL